MKISAIFPVYNEIKNISYLIKSIDSVSKKLDISKIKSFGWSPTINLEDGLFRTYKWFKQHYDV